MTVPRADATIAQRVKALEEQFRRIKLVPSTTQTDVAPEAAVKGAVWIDSSAGNEPKVFDGSGWVPVRDETIAVAQETADTAQATVDPLVPLTDLAAVTDGTTITGSTIATDDTPPRIALNDPAYPNELIMESGQADETAPGRLLSIVPSGLQAQSVLLSPKLDGASTAAMSLETDAVSLGGKTRSKFDGHEHGFNTFGAGYALLVTEAEVEINRPVVNADLTDPSNTFPANPQPASNFSVTDVAGISSTSFVPGTPVVGTAFTAPPTGKVYITVSGHIEQNNASQFIYLAFEVRNGAVVGSGTVFHAAVTDEGIGCGSAGGITRINGSNRYLLTGLTPGSSYNVQTMHLVTGGTGDIFYRAILVEPVL